MAPGALWDSFNRETGNPAGSATACEFKRLGAMADSDSPGVDVRTQAPRPSKPGVAGSSPAWGARQRSGTTEESSTPIGGQSRAGEQLPHPGPIAPSRVVAALFVDASGAYAGLPGIDLWDISRDARQYGGPHAVVAHPPCQRWGRYWHGSPRKPHQFKKGDDDGCFAAALAAVRAFGGVIEHPKDSHVWAHFGLRAPPRAGGWVPADECGGWTCCVDQGHYGHFSNKATWLYVAGVERPELRWGPGEQRIPAAMLARYGYEKARRIGVMAMVGGKHKTRIREATPPAFRDVLLSIARAAAPQAGRLQ